MKLSYQLHLKHHLQIHFLWNNLVIYNDVLLTSFIDSNGSLIVKTTEEQGVGARSLVCSILGVEGHAGALRWGLGRMTSITYSHGLAQTKQ